MDFAGFKKSLKEIPGDQSYIQRQKYILNFIDTEKEHFKKYILTTKKFSDGECYIGYLWDSLKNPKNIQYEEATKFLLNKSMVYVLWDIHSKENILIEDYWKFDKHSILYLDSKILVKGMDYLPEDIYIFDETFNWTVVLTHEYYNDEKRICFKCVK